MNKFGLVFASCILITGLFSCTKTSTTVDYPSAATCTSIVSADNTYTNSIKAIMTSNCAMSGCHSASSSKAGVNLSDYANTKSVFKTGNGFCSIHHGSGCDPMPEGASALSAATIQKIDCWAQNGYTE